MLHSKSDQEDIWFQALAAEMLEFPRKEEGKTEEIGGKGKEGKK